MYYCTPLSAVHQPWDHRINYMERCTLRQPPRCCEYNPERPSSIGDTVDHTYAALVRRASPASRARRVVLLTYSLARGRARRSTPIAMRFDNLTAEIDMNDLDAIFVVRASMTRRSPTHQCRAPTQARVECNQRERRRIGSAKLQSGSGLHPNCQVRFWLRGGAWPTL